MATKKKKVLLIDDEEDFCLTVKKGLEMVGGYEVSICSDSTKAMGEVKGQRPDLILLDIAMPDKSGFDIAAELKRDKETRHIPFVFLTGMIDEKEVEKRKSIIGKQRYISKPVQIEKLINVIDKLNTIDVVKKAKDKKATVTFLSRNQIDFMDKLGKDASFYHGFKLSRGEILSELVDFLMGLGIDIREIDLSGEGLAKGILKALNKRHSKEVS